MKNRLLGLCLTPVLFCLLDYALTLHGQSSAYWAGMYSQANEASPTFNYLLQVSPLAFVAGGVAWICVFVGIILLLPDVLALIVSIVVTLAHTAGACTWILRGNEFGYQICNGVFLLSAVSIAMGLHYGWKARPVEQYRVSLSPLFRWPLAACLFAIGAYLYLWPH